MRDLFGTERLVMRLWRAIIVAVIFVLMTGILSAQQNEASVQQSVTIEVLPMTQIRVSGHPQAFFIQDPPADPNVYATARDNNTSYSLLSNMDNMKIVASINNPMPRGTKLMIDLGSTKGISNGIVDISNAVTPVTAVSGIGRGSDRNQPINYVFAANAVAGNIRAGSRIVMLTVTD
jgi:hypothetical protein